MRQSKTFMHSALARCSVGFDESQQSVYPKINWPIIIIIGLLPRPIIPIMGIPKAMRYTFILSNASHERLQWNRIIGTFKQE